MVLKNSRFRNLAMLLAVTSIMSFSLISCGSSKPETNNSNNDSNDVVEIKNDNYVQDELKEEEKVITYTYPTDKYYHLDKNCSHDEKEEAITLVKKAAINCDYEPCPKCAGGADNGSNENDK